MGTWAGLRTVEACGQGTWQWPRCLAVSGSKLVSGSIGSGSQREVRVWGLEELELQHTLPQPAGSDVRARLVVDGEEGGGVGMEGVKRGRRGARGWGGKAWNR